MAPAGCRVGPGRDISFRKRQACRSVGQPRGTQRYTVIARADGDELTQASTDATDTVTVITSRVVTGLSGTGIQTSSLLISPDRHFWAPLWRPAPCAPAGSGMP